MNPSAPLRTRTANPEITGLPVALSFALALGLPAVATPSGYHPRLKEAITSATLAVLGEVVESWTPGMRGLPIRDDPKDAENGRVYRMKIKEVFKGDRKAGDEIVVWDPWYLSTAGYFVCESGENLILLVPVNRADLLLDYLDYGSDTLLVPIWNRGTCRQWERTDFEKALLWLGTTKTNLDDAETSKSPTATPRRPLR